MRKTIAILGNTGGLFTEVLKVLMKQNIRMLFVSEDEEKNLTLRRSLEQTETVAEVEFTGCERDGCWEADVIIIIQPEKASCSLLETIKEVATQKIVLLISNNEMKFRKQNFEQLLPNSKVVKVIVDLQKKEFFVSGKYFEVSAEVRETFIS